MITAVIIGFITGWAISMPVGPINATAISRTLKYDYRYGLAMGFGAAVMDVIYCGGAAQIHQFLQSSPLINLAFQAVGFFALFYLGIKTIRTNVLTDSAISPERDKESEFSASTSINKMHVNPRGLLGSFLLGIILYASNVAAVPEWITISALWRNYGLLEEGVAINAMFALGAGLGTAGWFTVLVRFIAKRRRGFDSSTLNMINRVAGGALLIFGLYFGYRLAFKTDWNQVGMSWHTTFVTSLDNGDEPLHAPSFAPSIAASRSDNFFA